MAEPGTIEQRVARHYAQAELEKKILDLLAADGKDIEWLTLADLAPVDEFHTGGREAMIAFAADLGFTPEMHILTWVAASAGRRAISPRPMAAGSPASTSPTSSCARRKRSRAARVSPAGSTTARQARSTFPSRPARSTAPT